MDVFTIQELKTLMERRGVCASLFMPTHRAWKEILKDPITMKNLVKKIYDGLAGTGMRNVEAEQYLSPFQRYLEDDDLFWRHSSDGLAAFLSHDFFRIYRLPLRFEAYTVLTDRFQIKPLLSLFSENGIFYLLALSQKTLHLYQASRFGMAEIEITTMPENINTILEYQDTSKEELHSGIRSSVGGYRTGFQGITESLSDIDNILLYAQAVDKGIHPVLKGRNNPLVLAGVEYLHPVYRNANTYPYLVEKGVPGNPDQMNMRDLHAQAWKIVEPIFQERRKQAIERYMNSNGLPITSRKIEEIVPASADGRIDTLFIDDTVHIWGLFDGDDRTVTLHDREQTGDGDLLDLATVNTLQNGGTVFNLKREDMPEESPVSAIFRY
ncbi:MAG: baeRF7 domain-containing protein [Candidatus Latescibacterota bacterium]